MKQTLAQKLAVAVALLALAALLVKVVWMFLVFEAKDFLQLLEILVWPAVGLIAVIKFREIFSYLFFSLKDFNFFGARGELKPPQQLINEKVDERIRAMQEQENNGRLIAGLSEQLDQTNRALASEKEIRDAKEAGLLANWQKSSDEWKKTLELAERLVNEKQALLDMLGEVTDPDTQNMLLKKLETLFGPGKTADSSK